METLFTGQEILRFSVLDSTNSYLKNICRNNNNLTEGLTVVTEYQTSGRGQIGNKWEAEAGKNLLFSLLLRPGFLNPEKQFLLNMSVCLAVTDSLNEIAPGFEIKWPNDFLYHKQKVGGVLIENAVHSGKIETAVIGIGINVNQVDFQDRERTSVKEITGFSTAPDFLLEKVLTKIEGRYLRLRTGNTARLFRDYYSVLYGMERELPVWTDGNKCFIRIIGVEPGGELIAMRDNKKVKFRFKEIRFLLHED